jgi:hypothetical protein
MMCDKLASGRVRGRLGFRSALPVWTRTRVKLEGWSADVPSGGQPITPPIDTGVCRRSPVRRKGKRPARGPLRRARRTVRFANLHSHDLHITKPTLCS